MNQIKYTKSFYCLSLLAVAHASHACSVCTSHALGAGMRAVGAQSLEKRVTIVGLTYTSFSKKNAGETPGTSEKHDQSEVGLDVSHGISDSWMLRAYVPFTSKRTKETG